MNIQGDSPMNELPHNPPYFDGLFARLEAGDAQTQAAFGRHVHWGYWPEPQMATGTAEDFGVAAERLCQMVCSAGQISDRMRVLDVGCGFGGTLASLNERYRSLEMFGVNIDARQLARAAELVQPCNGNSLELVEADAAAIPLEDNSFDVVLAVECIFHFDRAGFLKEAVRLLRPGGYLALSDFLPSERSLEYVDAVDMSADEAVRWSYGAIDLTCSLSRYRRLAQEAGFRVTQSHDITDQTMPTYDFLRSMAATWPEPEEIELFTRATRRLQKASRTGLLSYQILQLQIT